MRWKLAIVLVALGACGNDGGADGGADAAPPDGGGSPLVGSWRLVSDTAAGATVNGWLEMTATEYALGLLRPAPSGVLSTFTVSGSSLVLSGGATVPYTLPAANRLQLVVESQRTLVFEKATANRLDTIPLTGTVSYASGAPEMAHPRAALIFLARGDNDKVLFVNDVRDDRALTFSSGTTPIDFSRDREALGTERIVFGDPRVGIAIGMVVVYDDRDQNGKLADLFTPCSAGSTDCIRGLSPVYLGYRDGTSAALSASPYTFLRPGWTHALVATDSRAGAAKVGLLSSDPQATPAHDVVIPVDPATVVVPAFKL